MFIETSRPNDRVAQLTLNRDEKRNALSEPLLAELSAAIEHALIDAPSLLITGAGSCFSAGADLSEGDPAGIYPALKRVIDQIRSAPVAVIAHVNGPAIGAGAVLAAACDIRVVAPTARFAVPVALMGVNVAPELTDWLTSLVGGSRARTMLLTGAQLAANDAVASGFAAGEGTLDDALALAALTTPPDASATTIASIKEAFK